MSQPPIGRVRRLQLEFTRVDLDRLAVPTLGLLLLVAGVLLFHLTRGASFWADDWLWITQRRGDSLNTFLAPYNGHLSVIALAIYRVLFATAGLGNFAPYRVGVVLLSLLVAVLLFAYARPRVGPFLALSATATLLFLGPGWQDVLWPFQIPWLIVCAAGIAGLLLLERRTLAADVAASTLTLVAICSTSLGLAFALGIAADVWLSRRRWRDAWIVGVPLIVYAAWTLGYQSNPIAVAALPNVPLNIAKAAAAALSVPTGLSGVNPLNGDGAAVTYGTPLLAVALVLVIRQALGRRVPFRALSLAAVFVIFVTSVTVAHGGLEGPLASRYLYVYALLALLLASELLRGVSLSPAAKAAVGLMTVAAVISNIGSLRASGVYFRAQGASTEGALTELAIDRAHVSPKTVVQIGGYPFLAPSARSIFDAERDLGSAAYSLPELRRADALAQASADSQSVADGDVTFSPAPAEPRATPAIPVASAPPVIAAINGTSRSGPFCVRFTPAASLPPTAVASITVSLSHDVSLTTSGAPVTLAVRRFAPTFTAMGSVAANRSTRVALLPGSAPDPWYLQLSSVAPVRVCSRAA